MDKLFAPMDQAARKALSRHDKTFKFQSDSHLARYEQMTPGDFDAIERAYGTDGLVQYVTAMESRKLKGGGNGTA